MKSKLIGRALIAVTLASACASSDSRRTALNSLVQAEINFAKTSVAKGIRTAFLSFLSDSAIVFRPHPVNGQKAFRERQETPITLDWRPIYADLSGAEDFGYTTGPWQITDNSPEKRPPAFGNFFSVWQKQADGDWKVIIDIGISHPEPKDLPEAWQSPATAPSAATPAHSAVEIEREKSVLLQVERNFSEASQAHDVLAAYRSYLADEARLLRMGQYPLTEKAAIHAQLAERIGVSSWQPLRVEMAQSLDLAYTMGAYDFKPAATTAAGQKGYYVRVWKKQKDADWKVVLDVENPLPPETDTAGD